MTMTQTLLGLRILNCWFKVFVAMGLSCFYELLRLWNQQSQRAMWELQLREDERGFNLAFSDISSLVTKCRFSNCNLTVILN